MNAAQAKRLSDEPCLRDSRSTQPVPEGCWQTPIDGFRAGPAVLFISSSKSEDDLFLRSLRVFLKFDLIPERHDLEAFGLCFLDEFVELPSRDVHTVKILVE